MNPFKAGIKCCTTHAVKQNVTQDYGGEVMTGSDYLQDHTDSQTISRRLWCTLQKPNDDDNDDECALFKANDNEALTSGSTYLEIGKWL